MTRRIGACALLALTVLSACSSGSSRPPSPSPSAPAPTPVASGSVIGSVAPEGPGGPPPIPRTLSTGSAIGHTVFITNEGFVPRILLAGIDAPVIFWNRTNAAQGIRFLNYGGAAASGPIPPGGSWTFAPTHTASIVYASTQAPHRRGSLQIEQTQSTG
jgi:hypothetical protein